MNSLKVKQILLAKSGESGKYIYQKLDKSAAPAHFFKPYNSKKEILYKTAFIFSAPVLFSITALESFLSSLYRVLQSSYHGLIKLNAGKSIELLNSALRQISFSFACLGLTVVSPFINLADLIGSGVNSIRSLTANGSHIYSIKNKINAIQSANIMDEKTVKEMKQIAESMQNLFQLAAKEGTLHKIFKNMNKDMKSWLISIDNPFSGKHTYLLPFLAECACVNSDNFNRLNNNRRNDIEQSITHFIKTRFPMDQNTEINYLSLGGGQLLQDFIIINKLMMLGYKKININLVDPDHIRYKVINQSYGITKKKYQEIKQGNDSMLRVEDISVEKSDALKQFEYLQIAAKELNVSMTLNAFETIDEYATQGVQADIITAIDFDDFHDKAFDDTIKAQKLLHPEGRMFLSVGKKDYIFSTDQCILNKPELDIKNQLSEIFPKQNPQTLNIALLSVYGMEDIIEKSIIPYLKKYPSLKKVTLTIPRPQELNFFGSPRGNDHPNLHKSRDCLQHYFSLFLPRDMELKINFVEEYSSLDFLLSEYNDNQDLVFAYFAKPNTKGTKGVLHDINKLHKKFKDADFVCGMVCTVPEKNSEENDKISFKCEWAWNNAQKMMTLHDKDSEQSGAIITGFYNQYLKENNKLDDPCELDALSNKEIDSFKLGH